MTAKQIKFFGTKRQKAALKAKRKRKSSAASHRTRTKPNAPKKRKRTAASSTAPKKRKKARKAARKRNLGGLYMLTTNPGTPAKGRKKSMAKTKKKASSHKSAGHRTKKANRGRRSSRRINSGTFGTPIDWLSGGAGVIVGVAAARGLPQLLLGTKNTGVMGYVANAAATALATFAAHFAMPRNRTLAAAVLAGGAGATLSRIIGDYSLLGSYSNQLGLGDYLMNFNFSTPQYLAPGNPRGLVGQGGGSPASIPVMANSPAAAGVSGWGPNLY